jgi:hypothetical protein
LVPLKLSSQGKTSVHREIREVRQNYPAKGNNLAWKIRQPIKKGKYTLLKIIHLSPSGKLLTAKIRMRGTIIHPRWEWIN